MFLIVKIFLATLLFNMIPFKLKMNPKGSKILRIKICAVTYSERHNRVRSPRILSRRTRSSRKELISYRVIPQDPELNEMIPFYYELSFRLI